MRVISRLGGTFGLILVMTLGVACGANAVSISIPLPPPPPKVSVPTFAPKTSTQTSTSTSPFTMPTIPTGTTAGTTTPQGRASSESAQTTNAQNTSNDDGGIGVRPYIRRSVCGDGYCEMVEVSVCPQDCPVNQLGCDMQMIDLMGRFERSRSCQKDADCMIFTNLCSASDFVTCGLPIAIGARDPLTQAVRDYEKACPQNPSMCVECKTSSIRCLEKKCTLL
jgi:hypothetical protein